MTVKVAICTKIEPDIKEQIEQKAKENELTISGFVSRLLRKICRNKELFNEFCNF